MALQWKAFIIYTDLILFKNTVVHKKKKIHLYNRCPFPCEDTLLLLYLRGVHTFSVYSTENGFIVIILGIPAVIVGLVAAIRPSSYDMGKSFYKNTKCGSLKIGAKIERTRYTDITLTTLLLL